jgi:CrcB protein
MNWLMVIVGAALGAPLRYLTDRAIQTRHDTVFPWGTFSVNMAACAGLGLLAGAANATDVPSALQSLIGPGLCATLSTYSTFSFETLRLFETGSKLFAAANIIVSVCAGLGAVYLGTAITHALLT